VLDLDEALGRLAELAPEQGRLVDLRYFAGLSIEEHADAAVPRESPGYRGA
jgi:DNA-directed RNA polymerase specialized sigma24 family protein